MVIGGGPAGSTTAAVLAQRGVEVVLFEQARFPRHHVCESVHPASVRLLDQQLGIAHQLRSAGFQRSYGTSYVWGASRDPWRITHDERLERDLPRLSAKALRRGDYAHGYNVDRARFDAILRDAASHAGATVRGERVTGIVQHGAKVRGARIGSEVVEADAVVDASGQSCVLGRALGTTRLTADLNHTATYGRYEGAPAPSVLGRHLRRVVSIEDGWVWFLPMSPSVTSVGVVVRERAPLDRARFEELVSRADLPLDDAQLLTGSGRDGLHHARDWSNSHREVAGDGWLMVGDAAGFVDPILAGGVDAAVRGATSAGQALLRGFEGGSGALAGALLAYGEQVRGEYRAHLRLARYWYANNAGAGGGFWRKGRQGANTGSVPVRAFVFLASGRYTPDTHNRVCAPWQEQRAFQALGVSRDQVERARSGLERPRINLPPPGEGGGRLELFIASGCNLHCSFCCESERIERKEFMGWDEITQKLDGAARAGIDVIQFMGGEATLHPRFPDALKYAKNLGLGTYVITNLMRWRQEDFARAVGPWLDEVMVSMHAWGEEKGALVTGSAGWWRGFGEAATNARATLQGRVRCSTVLTRYNVDDLERIGEELMRFGPTAWVMGNAVPVVGTREEALDIDLSLTELKALRPRFEALSRRCAEAGCSLIFFAIPACALGPTLWDDTHDLYIDDQDLTDGADQTVETVTFWSKADDLPRPRPVTLGRTRAQPCADCSRASVCGGHFSAYFERFGTGELEPVHA